jgi:hypothetical protein
MKNLLVRDSSATAEQPIREHDVVVRGEIHKVKFEHGKDTALPYEVGVKFMQEGFTVSDESGKLARPAKTDETIRSRINRDEVVATYDELTQASLIMRAALLPGGEKFVDGKAKPEEIIAFLKAALPPLADEENLLEDDDEEEFTPEKSVPQEPASEPVSANNLVWMPVQGSSQVNAFAYDEVAKALFVEFTSDGLPVWRYDDVSPEKMQGFMAAQFKGSFLDSQIKKAGHKATKMLKSEAIKAQSDILPSSETPDEV